MHRILILFLLISINAHSKKHDVEITVYSAHTREVLKGATVVCTSDKVGETTLITNEEGVVVFKGLKGKELLFTIVTDSKEYQELTVPIKTGRKKKINHSTYIRWTKEKWEKEFEILKEEEYRKFEELVKNDTTVLDEESDTTIHEVESFFPGGIEALNNFIKYNVIYPAEALEMEVQGRVYVSFVVEKDGSISTIKIVRSVSKELDRECKRVLELMPRFIPGFRNGKPVRTRFTLPIIFSFH